MGSWSVQTGSVSWSYLVLGETLSPLVTARAAAWRIFRTTATGICAKCLGGFRLEGARFFMHTQSIGPCPIRVRSFAGEGAGVRAAFTVRRLQASNDILRHVSLTFALRYVNELN
jgi:hypothetical protein